MAGSYPDSPEKKFAYDEDGSVLWYDDNSTPDWLEYEASGITFATQAELVKANDTAPNADIFTQGTNDGAMAFCLYFPELRTIEGMFWWVVRTNARNSAPHQITDIQYSTNSTNGIDGDWTTGLADLSTTNGDIIGYWTGWSLSNAYRTQIQAVNWSNVRAIRWFMDGGGDITPPGIALSTLHVYGTIPTTQSPNRLLIMDNDTGLEYDMNQDWGDVPRGVTLDKEIFLRNNSATLTASNITVTFEDINPAPGGTSNTWHTIKQGVGAFGSSLNYSGSISPGADSDVLTVRLTVADDEDISLQEARMQVTVGTWA